MPKTKSRKRKHVLGSEINLDNDLEYLEKVVLGDGTDIFEQKDEKVDNDEVPIPECKLPAWVDESDLDKNEIEKSVREKKFLNVMKKPKWSEKSQSQKKDTNILQKSGDLILKSKSLEQGNIHMKKVNDLNIQSFREGSVNVVKFHPHSSVGMVGGLSGVLSLFQVDGTENTKLHSIKFLKFPVTCASFVKDAEEVIVGSKYSRCLHTFNLMTGQTYKVSNYRTGTVREIKKVVVSPDDKVIGVCGPTGKIYLLSTTTKECIDSLQMNENVTSLAFNADGSRMYSIGDEGDVYIWDMNTRQCIQKFTDDGSINGTAIDVSSNNSLLACGSNTGVVNIYDINKVMSNNFTPLKILYNIRNPITGVKFNPTSEILCISSYHKENTIRLVHLGSMTVYQNFPQDKQKVGLVNCVDFSPNSGYFAVGDEKRRAHLFRLKYYGNY
ncbi:UNVERIFIED_CONTAM: hypothetical protein PYX00_000862 [Menopon gallinae]|uniref:U3 small nucleolar RNA-associated protein 18 n=1 Tax=Menopon gallinae TaxID=328185 RepID=A0AAW2IAR3_9NEOP